MGVGFRTPVHRGAWVLVSGYLCLGVHRGCITTSIHRSAWVLVSGPLCIEVHGGLCLDLRASLWLGF